MNAICKKVLVAGLVVAAFAVTTNQAQAQYYVDPNQVAYPVYQSPVYLNGVTIDPRTGYTWANTQGTTIYNSAYDPYRGYAAPGSQTYVNRWERDAYGNLVNVQGVQWTNPVTGQRHGDMTRSQFTPQGTHREQVHFRRVPPG